MLEVFKDLTLKGDATRLDRFIVELSESLAPGWSRARDREQELERGDPIPRASPHEGHYVFEYARRIDMPAVSLFIWRTGETLKVSNIVPEHGGLTRSQYNAVLDEFTEQNARGIAERLGLEVSVTRDRQPITHWLSEEAARRLRVFSLAANKGTGSGHPMDFERWAAFLIKAHEERAALDSSTLQRWLIEEEAWPEETAVDLAVEYEFGRNILKAYDAQR